VEGRNHGVSALTVWQLLPSEREKKKKKKKEKEEKRKEKKRKV
jgi:hypothetical protein